MLKHLKNGFLTLMNDEEGATAIEYALIAAIVSVGIVAALRLIGVQLNTVFEQIRVALGGAVSG